MDLDKLIMYTVVAFFYITSPGPAIFLAITNGMTGKMKIVCTSSFANILGLFILSLLSILGLGTLLVASSTLFFIVKFIGAAYLIYLGIKQLRSTRVLSSTEFGSGKRKERSLFSYFWESFFLAVTNPKPILFFTALFPQFLNLKADIAPQFFIMTLIFMAISFASLNSYGFLSKSAKKVVTNQSFLVWFKRIAGGLFIGMGVKLLQLKRIQS